MWMQRCNIGLGAETNLAACLQGGTLQGSLRCFDEQPGTLGEMGAQITSTDNLKVAMKDKENGYTVLNASDLIAVHNEILQSNTYNEVADHSINNEFILGRYVRLCRRVAACEHDPKMGNMLLRPLHAQGRSFISTLVTTCKVINRLENRISKHPCIEQV